MTDNDCIFCRIVRGEIPCAKIYEDEAVLAFLDLGPVRPGHTLVVPKAALRPSAGNPRQIWRPRCSPP